MSKFYTILAFLIVAIASGFIGFFVATSTQKDMKLGLETDSMMAYFAGASNFMQATDQLDKCDYSEWQQAIENRDSYIKELEQKVIESYENNDKWVEAEKQWIADRKTLEQRIAEWEKGSTNLLKLFQQNILDNIAGSLIGSSFDNSAYNTLLRIAQIPEAEDLLLRQLVVNAMYACNALEPYVEAGIISSVPEYGEQCKEIEKLSNTLK